MMGGEAAAAAMVGKVVTHAGKEVAEESKSIKKELLEHAKQTPEFDMAARSYAKRVAIRQELLTSMYRPIAKMLGVANQYFEDDFENDMAKKLADVPEENITAPKPSIAAPAMQQLGFSLEEADLKEMYLNLLATASDTRKTDTAHPSFVEIIKQLSAAELPTLNEILLRHDRYTPIVQLKRVKSGQSGWTVLAQHIIDDRDPATGASRENPYLATYIDNWARLGLVEIDYASHLADEHAYQWVDSRPEMLMWRAEYETQADITVEFTTGIISPTAFGLSFAKVVGIVGRFR
ncbi:DUF4393 domain-containing protein [Pseudarthrobacter oxydans]|uniref:DUF4393 domain-containing protein n=1 Tax=Pseudarthrobacter oxydans TaxID=1671 RepID=UPI00344A7707